MTGSQSGAEIEGNNSEETLWRQIIAELQGQLADAEEVLQAIAEYKVDAFVMGNHDDKRVYTLKGSDHVYQVILDSINEGAATVGADGAIFYCNPAFAALLQLPAHQLIGISLVQHVDPADRAQYTALMEQSLARRSKGEVRLRTATGATVPVLLSCNALKLDSLDYVCLVATDLSEQKLQADLIAKRTAELLEANQQLQHEIDERKQTEVALNEVRQRLRQIQEMERLLLARELHDGPLQEVIAMSFDLSLLAQTLADQEQLTKVNALSDSVQRAARHLRLVAQTLRPPILAHLGLTTAIRSYLKQVQETRETPALDCVSSDELWSVPEESALALLRIVQQAVQNALQHAEAGRVEVRLLYDDNSLCLEVEDDGRGFSKPYHRVDFARDGHLGVIGMAERAEAIRGHFEVVSQPGHGTLIRVTVPKPLTRE
jgi:two-component system, NarL family, sensor kinase